MSEKCSRYCKNVIRECEKTLGGMVDMIGVSRREEEIFCHGARYDGNVKVSVKEFSEGGG